MGSDASKPPGNVSYLAGERERQGQSSMLQWRSHMPMTAPRRFCHVLLATVPGTRWLGPRSNPVDLSWDLAVPGPKSSASWQAAPGAAHAWASFPRPWREPENFPQDTYRPFQQAMLPPAGTPAGTENNTLGYFTRCYQKANTRLSLDAPGRTLGVTRFISGDSGIGVSPTARNARPPRPLPSALPGHSPDRARPLLSDPWGRPGSQGQAPPPRWRRPCAAENGSRPHYPFSFREAEGSGERGSRGWRVRGRRRGRRRLGLGGGGTGASATVRRPLAAPRPLVRVVRKTVARSGPYIVPQANPVGITGRDSRHLGHWPWRPPKQLVRVRRAPTSGCGAPGAEVLR